MENDPLLDSLVFVHLQWLKNQGLSFLPKKTYFLTYFNLKIPQKHPKKFDKPILNP